MAGCREACEVRQRVAGVPRRALDSALHPAPSHLRPWQAPYGQPAWRPCPPAAAPMGPSYLWGRPHGAGFPPTSTAARLLGWHLLEEVRDPLN